MKPTLQKTLWMASGILLPILAYLGATLYVERQAADEISRFVADSRMIQELQYEELQVGLIRQEIVLHTVHVRTAYVPSPVRIESVVIRMDKNDAIQQNGGIRCHGIHLPMDRHLLAALDPVLNDLGFSEIEARLEADFHIDRSVKTVRFEPVRIWVKDAFRMTIHVGLNGLFPEEIAQIIQNPFLLLKDAQSASLQRLLILYEDETLFPRIVDATAAKRGISRDDLTTQWGREIERQQAASQTKVGQAMWHALGEFIQHPQRIGIRMSPAEPVLFRDMAILAMMKGPEVVFSQLGVEMVSR